MAVTGGMCSIFDMLEEIKKACSEHKGLADKLELSLRPDFFFEKGVDMQKEALEFTLLKIVMKVAKKGIDMKQLFDSWDADGSGCRKYKTFA